MIHAFIPTASIQVSANFFRQAERRHTANTIIEPDAQEAHEFADCAGELNSEAFATDRGWWYRCRHCDGQTRVSTRAPRCRHCGFSQQSATRKENP
jgi:hypothetical protein